MDTLTIYIYLFNKYWINAVNDHGMFAYPHKASLIKNQKKARVAWLEQHCHDVKHHKNEVVNQLKEFKKNTKKSLIPQSPK